MKPHVSWERTEAVIVLSPSTRLFTVRSLQQVSLGTGARRFPTYVRWLNSTDLDWFLSYLLLRFSSLAWTNGTQ